MYKIEKIYDGIIPENLLNGLIRQGCPELTDLCELYVATNKQLAERKQAEFQKQYEREQAWMKRVNDGNRKAWIEYCERINKEKKAREAAREKDKEVESLTLKWKLEMMSIIEKREAELRDAIRDLKR